MIFGRPLEIHEHHDEEIQHDDAAGIDEYLNHSEKLRREQHVERRDRQEVQHEKQDCVDRIARADDQHGKSEDQRREHVERNRLTHQKSTFTMPVATTLAIATGISTFHPRRISWSYL